MGIMPVYYSILTQSFCCHIATVIDIGISVPVVLSVHILPEIIVRTVKTLKKGDPKLLFGNSENTYCILIYSIKTGKFNRHSFGKIHVGILFFYVFP